MDTPSFYDPQQSTYLIDPNLASVVKMARKLGMPLLVTGEPGTGKTRLARYVAEEMLGAKLQVFNTKTTSKAKDLLYRYNALTHFRDSQQGSDDINPMKYVVFEALGEAIVHGAQEPYVVLIDEIDKAPRDFPNDVLFEFEQLAFRVEEASREDLSGWSSNGLAVDDQGFFRYSGSRENRPVLILTSNSEKNLPDAFLRRCAYFHIPFPEPERLLEIVSENMPLKEEVGRKMLEDAIEYFVQVREDLGMSKKPATAELLAWVHWLKEDGIDLKKGLTGEDEEIRKRLVQSFSILAKNKEDLDRLVNDLPS